MIFTDIDHIFYLSFGYQLKKVEKSAEGRDFSWGKPLHYISWTQEIWDDERLLFFTNLENPGFTNTFPILVRRNPIFLW